MPCFFPVCMMLGTWKVFPYVEPGDVSALGQLGHQPHDLGAVQDHLGDGAVAPVDDEARSGPRQEHEFPGSLLDERSEHRVQLGQTLSSVPFGARARVGPRAVTATRS